MLMPRELRGNRMFIFNNGSSAVMHKTMFENIPVGYPAGTVIKKFNNMEFRTLQTLNDGDMKVFQAVLKIFTDNNFKTIEELAAMEMKDVSNIDFFDMEISANELSKVTFKDNRKSRRLDSLIKLAGFTITIFNEKGTQTGFFSLVRNSAEFSSSGKNIKLAINTRFLISLAQQKIQYNFNKMMKLSGFSHRLYSAMQANKHPTGKNKYGYHAVKNIDLLNSLNVEDTRDTRIRITKTFKEIGINFVFHHGITGDFWDYKRGEKEENQISP